MALSRQRLGHHDVGIGGEMLERGPIPRGVVLAVGELRDRAHAAEFVNDGLRGGEFFSSIHAGRYIPNLFGLQDPK